MPPDPETLSYRPCVGAFVLNAEGRVFLGQRIDMPGDAEGQGTWWQMPQGGIDGQEDPREAVLRELREETGITSVSVIAETRDWLIYDLPPELVGVAWGGRYRGQRQKWFALRFFGDETEIDVARPADGHKPEFSAWKWAPVDRLTSMIVPFKREVYERVVAEFSHLAG